MLKKISVLSALIVGLFLFTFAPTEEAFAVGPGDVRVDIHGPSVGHNGVYVGSAFQVDVVAEGISDVQGLAGGSFDLDFDETVLSVNIISPNDPQLGPALTTNGTCSFEAFESTTGVLSVAFTCSTAEVITTATNVVLATIVFEQTTVVTVDTPVVFSVSNPFLNDGSTPTPLPIDTTLIGVGDTATIYVGACGDQDGNGIINTIDATIDVFFSAGVIPTLTEEQLVLSDIIRDGVVNVGDAIAVLQDIVGLFPITSCGPIDPLV